MGICSPFVDTNIGKITVHTSGTRPTGVDLYEGKWIYESDTDRTWFYDGTGWVIMAEPPVSYTPTFTNLTTTGGTIAFTYRRSDGYLDVAGSFTFGVGSAITGLVGISTPVAMATLTSSVVGAQAAFNDTSAGTFYPLFATPGTTSRFDLYSINAAAAASANALATSATVPVAFGTGDVLTLAARYRMVARTS